MNPIPSITLNNNIEMPVLGLGTRMLKFVKAEKAVAHALEAGYRSIDTSNIFSNEANIGKALKESNIERSELFLSNKVFTSNQSKESIIKAFNKTRLNLNTDYLDLYLLHGPAQNLFGAWETLIELYDKGFVRAIGICNTNIKYLKMIEHENYMLPLINQLEYNPYITQLELVDYCKQKSIQVEAWGPLARGEVLDNKKIIAISQKYEKTPAQIVLRWELQNDLIVIPSSKNPKRLKENTEIFNFSICEEDMATLHSINSNRRWMWSYGS